MGQDFSFLSRNSERRNHYDDPEHPLQNLPEHKRDAHGLVQSPGGHEKQARSPAEPRHKAAHDSPGAVRELSGVFCEELVKQELDDTTPFFEIPEEIRKFYKMYRPSPLVRASCPSFTRGKYAYDFCDTGMVCPLAKMYTLGSGFIPAPNHAGGLRYHGMSSTLSQLYDDGLMEATSVKQTEVFEAAEYFARVEGILPAPESSHAIKVAIDEAKKCKETGEEKTIVFGLTGTGYFDMVAYEKFHDGKMSDYIPTDEELKASIDKLPKME